MENCPICLATEVDVRPVADPNGYRVACEWCGTFRMSYVHISYLRSPNLKLDRSLLSAIVRFHHGSGEPPILVDVDNLKEIFSSAPIPKTPLEAMDNLLLYIGDRQETFADFLYLTAERFYVRAASNPRDFEYVRDQLVERGLCESEGSESLSDYVRLTPEGWAHLAELRASHADSRQAFVAMSFSTELKSAWTDGIKPALEENGYTALRLDAEVHNEKIDDKIVVEIRRSGLVVADVTEQKTGVYFEAGFAMGIPVPVVWCCREDDLPNVHFDTRQFNYVVWKNPGELREALSYRIQAMRATKILAAH